MSPIGLGRVARAYTTGLKSAGQSENGSAGVLEDSGHRPLAQTVDLSK